jgi:hypothetical protein
MNYISEMPSFWVIRKWKTRTEPVLGIPGIDLPNAPLSLFSYPEGVSFSDKSLKWSQRK